MVSIVHAKRDIGRLREISAVLVRYGFGEIVARLGLARGRRGKDTPLPSGSTEEVETDLAELPPDDDRSAFAVRFRRVLEALGPSFIKLGQIASTRADLLPAELIAELKKLQDAVPEVPFVEIREQIERSLGTSLDQVFEHFDPKPLAAASIAQVHRANLRTEDGVRDVVVKVQRPGISEKIESDLDLLHMLATLIERAIPESRVYSPEAVVRQFDHTVHEELDFTIEAENARRFARNFEQFPQVRFPVVYREASSKRVLTLEYFDGRKLNDAISDGVSRRAIAAIAIEVMIKQIFDDGFFHADPHPGNVIVLGEPERPVIGLIDLGMVGRLSPHLRDLTVDLMVGAIRRDYDAIADAIEAIGTPTQRVDSVRFRTEVAMLAERYLGRPISEIEVSILIRDLVRLANGYGLEIPTDFLLVGKAMMTVEGIGKQLDPSLDIFEEARPHFLNLLKRRYSPERVTLQLLRRIERLSDATANLPHQLSDVLEDLRLGRMRITTESTQSRTTLDRLGRRVLTGCVFGSSAIGGAWLLSAEHTRMGALLLGSAALWLFGHVAADFYRSFGKD
ncbi:MAG: ABC1 kinase family protein [Myxococcales bacterium]